eukprot:1158327-Pelagomonas_calceolata.AAC.1
MDGRGSCKGHAATPSMKKRSSENEKKQQGQPCGPSRSASTPSHSSPLPALLPLVLCALVLDSFVPMFNLVAPPPSSNLFACRPSMALCPSQWGAGRR